jgi:hypothetical protein
MAPLVIKQYPAFRGPDWPAHLRTITELKDFLSSGQTTAIATALYGVDFHRPNWGSYAPDETAYTCDDPQSMYAFMLFGKVAQTVVRPSRSL